MGSCFSYGAPLACAETPLVQIKLKLIFSPFGWTLPSSKINVISRCFRCLSHHTPGHQIILWLVELKCWVIGNTGVLWRILCKCPLKRFCPASRITILPNSLVPGVLASSMQQLQSHQFRRWDTRPWVFIFHPWPFYLPILESCLLHILPPTPASLHWWDWKKWELTS